ncbi:MAG: threonylcarbamoyl-AMP synthase [Chloroflexi bacterium]|nr:threonylcarbamoyl-AMP synthase [Chloroflexota bacterium]
MNTEILTIEDPHWLARALKTLHLGELVAFPTDTVYGVGAPAFDARAVENIYHAKGRSNEKAIPVLLGDVEDLEKITLNVSPLAMQLATRFWPGPLTLVVPKHPDLPEAVSASQTVGVRVPDHPAARVLLRAAGPLAVTSANRSGEASPVTAKEVMEQLGGRIPLIIDGGRTPGGIPSTVVNCLGIEPVILREGPLTAGQVRQAAGLE